MGLFDEKTEGQKSLDTVPLMSALPHQLQFFFSPIPVKTNRQLMSALPHQVSFFSPIPVKTYRLLMSALPKRMHCYQSHTSQNVSAIDERFAAAYSLVLALYLSKRIGY
jgi:hypothetical protein